MKNRKGEKEREENKVGRHQKLFFSWLLWCGEREDKHAHTHTHTHTHVVFASMDGCVKLSWDWWGRERLASSWQSGWTSAFGRHKGKTTFFREPASRAPGRIHLEVSVCGTGIITEKKKVKWKEKKVSKHAERTTESRPQHKAREKTLVNVRAANAEYLHTYLTSSENSP